MAKRRSRTLKRKVRRSQTRTYRKRKSHKKTRRITLRKKRKKTLAKKRRRKNLAKKRRHSKRKRTRRRKRQMRGGANGEEDVKCDAVSVPRWQVLRQEDYEGCERRAAAVLALVQGGGEGG